MSRSDASPGEPGGPAGATERVQLTLWAFPDDRDYLDRRAAAAGCAGDRAAALRRVIAEARTFRHDLRGKLGALDLIELCLTSDAMTREEAARLIAALRRELRELIETATSGE